MQLQKELMEEAKQQTTNHHSAATHQATASVLSAADYELARQLQESVILNEPACRNKRRPISNADQSALIFDSSREDAEAATHESNEDMTTAADHEDDEDDYIMRLRKEQEDLCLAKYLQEQEEVKLRWPAARFKLNLS
jgi:hypothetical protein